MLQENTAFNLLLRSVPYIARWAKILILIY